MGGRSETKERRNSRPCLAHVRAFPLPGATHNTRRPLPPSTPLPPLRVGSLKRVLLAVCFTCFTCFICFICFACSKQTWAKRNADDQEGRYGVTSPRKPLRTYRGGSGVMRGGDALCGVSPSSCSRERCPFLPGRRKRPHSTPPRSRPYGYDPCSISQSLPVRARVPRPRSGAHRISL